METYGNALQALADPTRRAIFERVARRPSAVCDLAEGLPVSRPAVSQHLKVLKQARLVRERRQGTRRIYSAEREGLRALRQWIDSFWDDVLQAFKAEADSNQGEEDERS